MSLLPSYLKKKSSNLGEGDDGWIYSGEEEHGVLY